VTVVGSLASSFLGWLHSSGECSAADSGLRTLTALGHRLAHEGSRRGGSPPAVLAAAAAWAGRARPGAARGPQRCGTS
jgi:hypothetical protein